ncbi:MAG: threonine synthase, partial [Desulforhopalus sp.]
DDCGGYLLDPHGCVAAAAAARYLGDTGDDSKVICLATAHPAKFPAVVSRALNITGNLPAAACHPSLVEAKSRFQHYRLCGCEMLEQFLVSELPKNVSRL